MALENSGIHLELRGWPATLLWSARDVVNAEDSAFNLLLGFQKFLKIHVLNAFLEVAASEFKLVVRCCNYGGCEPSSSQDLLIESKTTPAEEMSNDTEYESERDN